MIKKVIIGFVIAGIFWFLMFFHATKDYFNFWAIMMTATATLNIFSLWSGRKQLKEVYKFEWKWIPVGIIAAASLYLLFFAGNFFSKMIFNFAGNQIDNIYATKTQAGKVFIGLALLLWIGPAEEIFWRGFAQHNLSVRFGENRGFIITTLVYAFVHIWSFNFMLFMAALICGIFWGWMYKRFKSLIPCLISHALWDCVIFVVLPVS